MSGINEASQLCGLNMWAELWAEYVGEVVFRPICAKFQVVRASTRFRVKYVQNFDLYMGIRAVIEFCSRFNAEIRLLRGKMERIYIYFVYNSNFCTFSSQIGG